MHLNFMYARIFILFLCIITFSTVARADTFTVTSNADSGPGTLREALTLAAANGSTVKDYIYFNLPDLTEGGRTITIFSSLPNVSSNLVIDGTTQSGLVFGVSNAKVLLQPDAVFNKFNGFTLKDVDGFELYGFYIRDFMHIFEWYLRDEKQLGVTSALYVESCKNIQLGAPGKGNVFSKNGYALRLAYVSSTNQPAYPEGVENLKVYSNFIGVEPDGKSYRPSDSLAYCLDITACKGVVDIGGDDVSQRNILANTCEFLTMAYRGMQFIHPSTINIKNNYFNFDVDGQPIPNLTYNRFSAIIYFNSDPNDHSDIPYSFNIINNKIQYPQTIQIGAIAGDIILQGNQQLKETGPVDFYEKRSLLSSRKGKIIIGGDQPGQGNTFYGFLWGLNAKSIIISHTAIFCEDIGWAWSPGVSELFDKIPKVNINQITSTQVSGTASPFSVIELFWDDNCTKCLPQTYFHTTAADANGNWTYNGSIQRGVVASATLNGYTSLFTESPTIQTASIQHTSCNKNVGFIKLKIKDIGSYQWINERGDLIGSTNELSNLAPGKYKLKALNGSCSKEFEYEIFDATPKINESYVRKVNPSCNQKGSVTYLYLDNYNIIQNDPYAYSYKWTDAANRVRSTGLDLTDAEAGAYRLEVSYKDQCKTIYNVILTNQNGPSLNQTSAKVTPSNCNNATGSITGIIANAINPTFSWKNESQTEVSTSIDLLNQPPGKYILTITDDSNCGPVITDPIIIPALNDIAIITTNKQIQKATCDNYNGAITGITATGNGTLTYKWTNEQDQLVGGDLDLMGVGPGKYKLTVTSGACSPVATDFIEISSINGVSLNTTNVSVRSQTACAMGQITGLSSPDATSFTWRRKNSTDILSSTANLLNVPAGDYELTIANAACTKAIPFSIAYLPPVNFSAFPYTTVKSCQAFGTGSIVLNTSNAASQPIAYRWVNQLGQNVGFDKKVANLPAGRYKLFATDYTGCETSSPIQEVIIDPIPAMAVTFGAKHDIYCGVGKGSIDAPVVSGGRGSYIYTWKDASGNAIAPQTKSSLTDLAPGYYSLEVLDKDPLNAAEIACNSSGVFTYHIEESNAQVPAPVVNDKDISYKGNTILAVENPYTTAIYRLYDSETAATPIDEQQGGKFSVNVSETRSYWVGLTYGSCESARTKVTIKLLKSTGLLPNAFTPNGDGINDTWMLANMDINIINTVKVFNRNGQAVFESRGYMIPFDGNYNGKQLAAGVYYYIIDLKKGKPLSGHVTIIR